MTDRYLTDHPDDAVLAAFADFRDEVTPLVLPPGTDGVRATVRTRRRTRVLLAGAAALALGAVPAVVYQSIDRAGPPASGPATAPPTAEPPTAPSTPATTPPTATPPDGRIWQPELLSSRIDLPPWQKGAGCRRTGVRLTDDPGRTGTVWLRTFAHGDVDRDGAEETVVVVRCMRDDVGFGVEQAVALDRDTDGRITLVGRVVATDDDVAWLPELDPQPDGSIRVRVGDRLPFDDQPAAHGQYQWRIYAYDGERFRQTDGPHEFGVNPRLVDLSVTAADLRLTGDPAGRRTGTLTVTVTNRSARTAKEVTVQVEYGEFVLWPVGPGWDACMGIGASGSGSHDEASTWHTCAVEVPGGRTLTLRLGVAADPGQPPTASGQVSVYHEEDSPLPLPDLKPADNRDAFRLS
jgi:hypothetical protein